MIHRMQIKYFIHGYFLMTVIGFLLWIHVPETHAIQLFGCHATLYIFLTALLFGDLGAVTLARACFILWPIFILALLVCYLIAAFKRKYMPLAIITVIDVVFSIFVSLRYLQLGEVTETIICLIGMLSSLLTAWVLFMHCKHEMFYMPQDFETNP